MDAKRTFAVVLEPEEEGGFTVRVPAFPEIVTYGKDEQEALAMAEDAIRLVITTASRAANLCPVVSRRASGKSPLRLRHERATAGAHGARGDSRA
jgi:predicted RNase H-like HicB family nuclease